NRSFTVTPVALLGPLLVRLTVKVMVSPRAGFGLLTALVTARSAVKVVKANGPTRSERLAFKEVEERDSTIMLARWSGRPRAVRSMPPSMNCPGAKVLAGVAGAWDVNGQPPEGVLTVFVITKMSAGSNGRSWREAWEPPGPTHL